MKVEINAIYEVCNVHEISVDIGGFSYLVIYGQHINGWFISIFNKNVCIEAAQPEDIGYSAERLNYVLGNMLAKFDVAYALAEVVYMHWESQQEGCKDG